MRQLADYTLGVFLVLSYFVVVSLREGRRGLRA